MLMVCTACAAEVSCDVFNCIIPPAGAIFAKVRSFRPPVACVLLEPAGDVTVVVGATVVAGVVVVMES